MKSQKLTKNSDLFYGSPMKFSRRSLLLAYNFPFDPTAVISTADIYVSTDKICP